MNSAGDSGTFPRVGAMRGDSWRFSQASLDLYARLSGDHNPIHVDAAYAARSRFGRPVAHGMLLWGVVAGRVRAWLAPLPLTQVALEVMFAAPTYPGEEQQLHLEVIDARPETGFLAVNAHLAGPHGDGLTGRLDCATGERAAPMVPALHSPRLESARQLGPFALGAAAEVTRSFSATDVEAYLHLTGDRNPVNGGRQCVPAPLMAGLISHLLGTVLPGPGTNWLKQRFQIGGPALAGQTLRARVTIARLRPAKRLVNLRTEVLNQAGQALLDGEALVLAPGVA